jgi:hypothetical protein
MKRSLADALLPLALIAGSIAASGAALAQPAPPQCNDFIKLRDTAQEKAGLIRAATSRKADRKEVCTLVQRFAVAEEAVVNFLEKNKTWCGVPEQAIKGAKAQHEQTLKFRTMACTEAPQAKPREPTLSDAIAQPSLDTAGNTKTGGGTLDSLNGNPLAGK